MLKCKAFVFGFWQQVINDFLKKSVWNNNNNRKINHVKLLKKKINLHKKWSIERDNEIKQKEKKTTIVSKTQS